MERILTVNAGSLSLLYREFGLKALSAIRNDLRERQELMVAPLSLALLSRCAGQQTVTAT
jgi:hypothetical protein